MNRRTLWGRALAAAGIGAAPSVAVSAQPVDRSGTPEERIERLETQQETLYQLILGLRNDIAGFEGLVASEANAAGLGESSGDPITISVRPNPPADPASFQMECDIVRANRFGSDNPFDRDYTLICQE